MQPRNKFCFSDTFWTSEVAKGKLHSILSLEVSQLSKPRVSDCGTICWIYGAYLAEVNDRHIALCFYIIKPIFQSLCGTYCAYLAEVNDRHIALCFYFIKPIFQSLCGTYGAYLAEVNDGSEQYFLIQEGPVAHKGTAYYTHKFNCSLFRYPTLVDSYQHTNTCMYHRRLLRSHCPHQEPTERVLNEDGNHTSWMARLIWISLSGHVILRELLCHETGYPQDQFS